ncbi:23S rRNA (pseudouridine(1915)-N(3))-methyltransferase RlmH [Coprococcus eutactus]|uniref:23S rRNA (Pseudouridine(1915)-N(3))-methyltransferase RlmH n=2 Tax=Bacillota TaxID=1239 RepID=A0A8I0DS21_9FIRM|nr:MULTISPECIES: 23S rRNA (pseudouridine(1915)-N(3))-methyltransferase RlmH [Clostridia]RGG78838.1 23S rRNA (pseudouridine(1915)-N(3))-methyltransferase RlmH [Clostridium sp. AF17-21AC]RHP93638.1 23S rRNA (pseudouridine(1915)-N(3))-methyltransferase RlmH [Clostridium sp. AM54-37XD]MBC5662678.1 23S rRNA (pseudouridine(1915)-N(3))-methyltransferase RlmH [Coprococcus hominis (ex Liu et al. 2022)]MCB5505343.1 23S rRNA (pseudouridine(1915)-N(3))-methyltransferase RlmH [Coprococcus eutactus]NSC97139
MLFKIICVGKIKEEYYSSQIQELCKQINKKNRVEIIQSEDEKIPKNASDAVKQKIIETESRNSLASIGKNDFVIALCIEGKKYTTEQFAAIIRQAEEREYEAVSFLIGGSLGTSNELVRCADVKMSFSDMTFPHQLMRVMLLDQIRIICDK